MLASNRVDEHSEYPTIATSTEVAVDVFSRLLIIAAVGPLLRVSLTTRVRGALGTGTDRVTVNPKISNGARAP